MNNIQMTEENTDLVKILELSNFIDEWEQTVLFSQDGFYTLKGKDVQGKTEELLEILKKDTEKVLEELNIKTSLSQHKAEKIRKAKIKTIEEKMVQYEQEEKFNYEIETVKQTIEASKNKAAAYKTFPEVVEKCYLNALSAISLKAGLEESSKTQVNEEIEKFNSEFFENIVWSFISENSDNAQKFYTQNRHYILKERQEIIEKSLGQMINKKTAFEKAKELIFKNSEKSKSLEAISKIKDEEIKKYTKLYFEGLFNSKENLRREEKAKLNDKIWKNIDKSLKENSDLALSYVDLNQEEEAINAQINYIKTMIKNGKIQTDNKKFFELFRCAFEEPQKYSEMNLNNSRHQLSKEDFEYLKDLQNNPTEHNSEYFELKQKFEKDDDFNAQLIKTYISERKIEEKNTGKQTSLSRTAELVESIAVRLKTWDLFRKRG